jgi:2,3-bisphosphoglycerate-independent phosphoglycerate mutase
MLMILDGWGMGPRDDTNAIALSKTPVMDGLMRDYPCTELGSSGEAVGLPPGQMGNSEVGHLNIGAGRLVMQDYQRINHAISDGTFFSNDALLSAIEHAKQTGGTLHLLGLLSDGGVHSHIKHLFALIDMARKARLGRVVTHAFLDGRDVPPRSALQYVRELDDYAADGTGRIRTIAGRYYGMDRDNRWDRTKLAYDAIVHAEGPAVGSASEAVEDSYAERKDDEFLVPRVVGDRVPLSPDDSAIFFNFRPDRPRQLTEALIEKDFDRFDRGRPVFPYMVTMTEYDDHFGARVAFLPEKVTMTLADVLALHHKRQLHIAETEKYAHVTYFFNGGIEEPKEGEDRVLIPSPKVATYDLKPEMSAAEVADEAVRRVRSGVYDFIVLNFANCDMVGHTGFMDATIQAVETVDTCVGKVLSAVFESGGAGFVTADHGNADLMLDGHHDVCTAHSTSPVPFINATSQKRPLRKGGSLGDIAPTVLEVLELEQPREMTGRSLFAPVARGGP